MKYTLTSPQADFLYCLFRRLCELTNAIGLVKESTHVDDIAGDSLNLITGELAAQNESLFETFGSEWQINKRQSPEPSFSAPLGPFHYPTTIGERIKSMREAHGMGQRPLANHIGVTRSCVEAWEENTTVPGSDKIIPLSEALNCDPLWLITGSGASQADALSHATPQP